jgi:hypothetical protein
MLSGKLFGTEYFYVLFFFIMPFKVKQVLFSLFIIELAFPFTL